MVISVKIPTLRKEKGWNQGLIIGGYERNEMAPSVEVAKKPDDTFDITLDYLVDDTDKLTDIKDKAFLNGYFRLKSLIRKTGKQLCMQLTAC